ncbi:unnamed protein product [Sphagnum jensenii]|uniref:Uncharacterized protein n=1 Tax=Sphagnum jensenii TaxID=128206 RepID=A0ABP1B2J5_9BRYO
MEFCFMYSMSVPAEESVLWMEEWSMRSHGQREGEQNQILNSSLLEKIHEEYIGKVKGIQHVHFAAMEPILACTKVSPSKEQARVCEGMIKDWVMIFPCIHQSKPMVITKLGAKL